MNHDDFDQDLQAFVGHGRAVPRGARRVLKILGEPGLTFVWLMRRQLDAERRGMRGVARALHLLNLRATGAEVGHGCDIGPGFVAKHPLGMVIGGGTVLGARCTVLHNVTFGEVRPGDSSSAGTYPRVGDDVLIGNGAVLLGSVEVGNGAVVGASAVVTRDVIAGSTVVGIPAREVSRRPLRSEPQDEGPGA